MRKRSKLTKGLTFPLVSLIFLINSCRSTESESNNITGQTLINGVSFNFSGEDFNNENSINTQASIGAKNMNVSAVSRKEQYSGPFSITSELSSTSLSSEGIATQASSKTVFVADKLGSSTNPIKYRIVAYKADGSYVDQAIGDSSNSNQVFFQDKLEAGQKYTFVVYSLGATVSPVAAPTNNLDSSVLSISGLNGDPNGTDLMYAIQKDVTILSGDVVTPLNMVLKHMFTKLTLQVYTGEESGTYGTASYKIGGYPLDNDPMNPNNGNGGVGTTGTISNFYSSVNLNLNGGAITGVTKTALNITGISSIPKDVIINTGVESAYKDNITFAPGAIEIGNDINPSNVPISISGITSAGLKVGTKYNLNLTFNSDRYVDGNNNTQSDSRSTAARYVVIGGLRFDRYNLGVANLNPATNNPEGLTTNLIGNYYQWGKYNRVADANGNIQGGTYNQTPTDYTLGNPWVAGLPIAPVKGTNDPCPLGQRMFTKREQIKLNNTTSTLEGTNYQVLYSTRASNIKITFPNVGYYSSSGTLNRQYGGTNGAGIYWLGSVIEEDNPLKPGIPSVSLRLDISTSGPYNFYTGPLRTYATGIYDISSDSNRLVGLQIRCIQDRIDANPHPMNASMLP
ncbi:TPA: hypothetical protein NEG48_003067 [Elizabethkingia anophelis]|nr:hypothetical protein [Elizabethkingia anophelis]